MPDEKSQVSLDDINATWGLILSRLVFERTALKVENDALRQDVAILQAQLQQARVALAEARDWARRMRK